MKKYSFYQVRENAQVIPLVVISLAVLIMMVALLLDGGALMLNRRTAQNAADAGALAGARELCMGNGEDAAIAAAINYAVTENGATSAIAEVSYDEVDKGEVIVNVLWEQGSLFARIFNLDTLTTGAVAGAGCFTKGGKYILPVTWSCRPPDEGSDSRDCNWLALDWQDTIRPVREYYCTDPLDKTTCDNKAISDTLGADDPLTSEQEGYLSDIYIIMDAVSTGTEIKCTTDGGDVNCDINNDGRNDIEAEGNRSWLDLDGKNRTDSCKGGGANELECWIEEGFDDQLDIHMWLSSQTGNITKLYETLKLRVGDVVRIPVFNQTCTDNPDTIPACKDAAHVNFPLDDPYTSDTVIEGTSKTYFHIVGFASFYVTCVHSKNSDKCPGYDLAIAMNPSYKNKVNTVEGYFIKNYPEFLEEITPGGVDLGNYIVSLTR